MQDIKAIETEYNGYRFRSRLEARWAVFFDAIGIEYDYEVEGYCFSDGTKYLPDFYLPESDAFFEVKGKMDDYDMHKVKMLIKEINKPCTIGYSDFTFQSCDKWSDNDYDLTDKISSVLVECTACHKKYFAGINGQYVCQVCGAYDGDHYFNTICDGDHQCLDPIMWDAILKAKQARFEHGEKGALYAER